MDKTGVIGLEGGTKRKGPQRRPTDTIISPPYQDLVSGAGFRYEAYIPMVVQYLG